MRYGFAMVLCCQCLRGKDAGVVAVCKVVCACARGLVLASEELEGGEHNNFPMHTEDSAAIETEFA